MVRFEFLLDCLSYLNYIISEEFGGELSGVTYCTKARLTENFENVFYVGFPIELALSYNLKKLNPERG